MCDHLDQPDGLKVTREPLWGSGLLWVVRHRDDPAILEAFYTWPAAMQWVDRYIELES